VVKLPHLSGGGFLMLDQFKGKQFSKEIIILCVRWYLKYNLSYRDLQEMMLERGIEVSHTTVYRWVWS